MLTFRIFRIIAEIRSKINTGIWVPLPPPTLPQFPWPAGADLELAGSLPHQGPYFIFRQLTDGAVRAGDRRALFVGIAVYEAAAASCCATCSRTRWRLAGAGGA